MASSPSPAFVGLGVGDAEAPQASTPRSSASASPTTGVDPRNLSQWWDRLYAASTFTEGLRVVFEVVPLWVPVAGVVTTAGAYYVTFRVRLFLAQWRIAERRRAERKYELLDNLRGMTTMPVGAVHALGDDDDDDDDDDEEEEEDETAVSRRDVDEFRSSLGIRLPRDEDLMAIVERMLMSDSLPDGWVLYRTSAGIIRFMNLNTQELLFFPPNKRKEKMLIESELRKRNREAMESRYNFSYEDEGMNSSSLSPSTADVQGFTSGHRGSHDAVGTSTGNPASPIDFNDGADSEGPDEGQASTFTRVFNYFLEREQRKIEQDVARARSSRESSVLGPPSSTLPSAGMASGGMGGGMGGGGAGNGGGAGSGAGGGMGGAGHESTAHRPPASMTYRVVSSSAIHGNRGGNS